MKKLLSRILGKPTQQQLWNKYYTAKMKGDFTRVREIGNQLVNLRKTENFIGIYNNIPEILNRFKK